MARSNIFDRPYEIALGSKWGERLLERAKPVPKIAAANLSVEEFNQNFRKPRQPVVLTGIVPNWPAWKNWNLPYLRERIGDRVGIASAYSREPYEVRIAELIDAITIYDPSQKWRPPYLQEWALEAYAPELLADFATPPYFKQDWIRENLGFSIHSLWLGAQDAHTPIHQDIGGLHVWNAQIFGRKLWLLLGPQTKMVNSLDEAEWQHFLEDPSTDAHYFYLEPGELAFSPQGWWHRVKSLENSLSLSGHFLDAENVAMLMKTYMITGCIGWLNHQSILSHDPGLYATMKLRARNAALRLGLDPVDILGINKTISINSVTEFIYSDSDKQPETMG